MKINQLCKFILHYLGSWLIFIWEVGLFSFGKLAYFHLESWLIFIWKVGLFSFGKLAYFHLGSWLVYYIYPSSILLTSPHIIEVVREAIHNKIYRNIDAMLQDIADLKGKK